MKKSRREKIRAGTRTAPEIDKEKPDPVSIVGVGDGAELISSADTESATKKVARINTKIAAALEKLIT